MSQKRKFAKVTKYFEVTKTENATLQNLRDAATTVHRKDFIAVKACIGQEKRSQINNLHFHRKKLEKEEQAEAKVSRRNEVVKIRAKINGIKTRKTKK